MKTRKIYDPVTKSKPFLLATAAHRMTATTQKVSFFIWGT